MERELEMDESELMANQDLDVLTGLQRTVHDRIVVEMDSAGIDERKRMLRSLIRSRLLYSTFERVFVFYFLRRLILQARLPRPDTDKLFSYMSNKWRERFSEFRLARNRYLVVTDNACIEMIRTS
ncbi:hypothetical protein FACS1894211_12860 [Clostridia bacterium]|nr:hypothetical protein FACS1894211_12860 [Clostridia bacterium]